MAEDTNKWLTNSTMTKNFEDFFFFQAEDGIRDVERSRGLGDVYKRQIRTTRVSNPVPSRYRRDSAGNLKIHTPSEGCLQCRAVS